MEETRCRPGDIDYEIMNDVLGFALALCGIPQFVILPVAEDSGADDAVTHLQVYLFEGS